MSRGENWIPIDKNLQTEFKSINRPFSRIEAMYSFTLDMDNGNSWSERGYSVLWKWSRTKVRRFLSDVLSEKGHIKDHKKTIKEPPIHFIDKGLWSKKNHKKTIKKPKEDHTINPRILESYNPRILESYNPKEYITQEIIDFSVNFIDFICDKKENKAPNKTNSHIKNSVLSVGRLIRIDKFELDYIKAVCKWALKHKFWSENFYSLARLRDKWGKNDLKKFQEMANQYDSKNKNRVDGNNFFEGRKYEGTKPEDIGWFNKD